MKMCANCSNRFPKGTMAFSSIKDVLSHILSEHSDCEEAEIIDSTALIIRLQDALLRLHEKDYDGAKVELTELIEQMRTEAGL